MPYILRKAPGRNKYWVVAQDGTHKSKEPLTKKKAQAQMRALYASEFGNKKGGSFEDWFNPIVELNNNISKAIQDGYDEALTLSNKAWEKVKQVGDLDSDFWVTQHYPTAVQETIEKHKDLEVESIILRKAPVQAALEYALEAFSLGKWTEAKKKLGYDSMFHLSVLVNGKFVVEKLARINVNTPIDNPANAEYEVVKVTGKVTLGEMMEKTHKHMGGKFFPYDPFQNNCQDFVNGVMEANKDVFSYGKKERTFVKQTVDQMISDLPEFLPSFARTVTSLGGLTGGANEQKITANELLTMCRQSYKFVQGETPAQQLGEWKLVQSSFTLLLYQKDNYYIVAVRGTKEFRDVQAWKPVYDNQLKETTRYKDDYNTLKQWLEPLIQQGHYIRGTGHSLGGALCDCFASDGLFQLPSVTFNPAIEPQYYNPTTFINYRIYFQGDPLYALFGKNDKKAILVIDPEPGWMSWLTGVDYESHKLENFEGQLDDVKLGGKKPVDLELLAVLEGGGLLPRTVFTTVEQREVPERRRDFRESELGLRAIAHLDDDALRRYGARVMADDLYEFDTGQPVDEEHVEARNRTGKEAFSNSRAAQIEQKRRVDDAIKLYNLKDYKDDKGKVISARSQAYEYILNPPKKVEKVKTKAELKAEAEEEERRMKEIVEAQSRKEKEALLKKAEAEAEQKRIEEARRIVNELHEAEVQRVQAEQREKQKIIDEENAKLEKARLEAIAKEEAAEEERRKAREKEQEKAREKKKKAKKAGKESEEEKEEELPEELQIKEYRKADEDEKPLIVEAVALEKDAPNLQKEHRKALDAYITTLNKREAFEFESPIEMNKELIDYYEKCKTEDKFNPVYDWIVTRIAELNEEIKTATKKLSIYNFVLLKEESEEKRVFQTWMDSIDRRVEIINEIVKHLEKKSDDKGLLKQYLDKKEDLVLIKKSINEKYLNEKYGKALTELKFNISGAVSNKIMENDAIIGAMKQRIKAAKGSKKTNQKELLKDEMTIEDSKIENAFYERFKKAKNDKYTNESKAQLSGKGKQSPLAQKLGKLSIPKLQKEEWAEWVKTHHTPHQLAVAGEAIKDLNREIKGKKKEIGEVLRKTQHVHEHKGKGVPEVLLKAIEEENHYKNVHEDALKGLLSMGRQKMGLLEQQLPATTETEREEKKKQKLEVIKEMEGYLRMLNRLSVDEQEELYSNIATEWNNDANYLNANTTIRPTKKVKEPPKEKQTKLPRKKKEFKTGGNKFIHVLPQIKNKLQADLEEAIDQIQKDDGTANLMMWARNNGLSRQNLLLFIIGGEEGTAADAEKRDAVRVHEVIQYLENRVEGLLRTFNDQRPEQQDEWWAKKMNQLQQVPPNTSSNTETSAPPRPVTPPKPKPVLPPRRKHSHVRDLGLPKPKHKGKEVPETPKPKPKKKEFKPVKPSGKGRQHKPFIYSREGLTEKEKGAERARHYRKVKREQQGAFEVKPGQTRALQRFDEQGNPAERGEIKRVTLTEREREVEAARGLRPPKETRPKKDSERKAYVGSNMKKKFMEAGGNETQLKRAKRLYKEGNLSWEQVIQQIVG